MLGMLGSVTLCVMALTAFLPPESALEDLAPAIFSISSLMFLLALLPTQTLAVRLCAFGVVTTSAVVAGLAVLQCLKLLGMSHAGPHFDAVFQTRGFQPGSAAAQVLAAVVLLGALGPCYLALNSLRALWVHRSGRLILLVLWGDLGRVFSFEGAVTLLALIVKACTDHPREGIWRRELVFGIVSGSALLASGALASWPGFRVHLQAWLACPSGRASAAAGVAALANHRPVDELLQQAMSSFRSVTLDAVTEEEFAIAHSVPELFQLSEVAELGEVDAFLSHSWHDPPHLKWKALQAWRQDFKWRHGGREPRLWIDKYCVDQSRLLESLEMLPVFLAGCTKLVVLVGGTYHERLWCLVELFTFITMGGTPDEVQLIPLAGARKDWSTFDARHATCESDEDRARLLTTMEAGTGTINSFNDAIKEFFAGMGRAPSEASLREDTNFALPGPLEVPETPPWVPECLEARLLVEEDAAAPAEGCALAHPTAKPCPAEMEPREVEVVET